jgi:hypothetical protein
MKKNFFRTAGAFAALIIVLALGGCLTFIDLMANETEKTETSQMLMEAANEMLLARDNGLIPDQFKPAFEKQVPGSVVVQFTPDMNPFSGDISAYKAAITYQEKSYEMELSCTKVSDSTRITTAKSCVEKRKKKKSNAEE